jgi:hypothetical protein
MGRTITLVIGSTVAAVVLAAVLPRLIPTAAVIFVMMMVGRYVWFYTR